MSEYVSKAAAAMYPHLARQERTGGLRDRSESRGEWAKSDHPAWIDRAGFGNLHRAISGASA
jgi:hypothetical protein